MCGWRKDFSSTKHLHTHTRTHTHTVTHAHTQTHMAFYKTICQYMRKHHIRFGHPATHINILQHTATKYLADLRKSICILLSDVATTATQCIILQHKATHCNTLQHTATHCNTLQLAGLRKHTVCILSLQHTATHCNTLHHTATRSNVTVYRHSTNLTS